MPCPGLVPALYMVQVEPPVEATLVVGLSLALLHLCGAHVRRRLFSSERMVDSLAAGAAVAYVFLLLLPTLDRSSHLIGEVEYAFLLAGFLIFYGVEHLSMFLEAHGRREAASIMFWVQLALRWIRSWLFIYALPGHAELNTLFLVVSTVAVALSIVFEEEHHAAPYAHRFRWHSRAVLATAPLVAVAVDLRVDAPDAALSDVLTALLAGSVLLSVFGERLNNHSKVDFRYFLAGSALYICLFLMQVDVL